MPRPLKLPFRLVLIALFAIGLAAASGASAVAATAKCNGTNILPKLTKSHPEIMASVRATAARIKHTEAILWRIEKPAQPPSHLFGTMHVADARIATLPPKAAKALAKARLVALEIADMSPTALTEAVAKVPELMIYMDGRRLDTKLTAAEFDKVAALLAKAGLPGELARVTQPWLVSTMLALPDCELARSAAGQNALDQKIAAEARRRKIPVAGLETAVSQLRALAAVPEIDQIAMLRVSLAFIDQREDLFETLIDAYLKRDLGLVLALTEGMARIAGLERSGFASFSRELIAKRNQKMFDASLPMADQGGAFIAVGAAHLIGDTGLVALFRKAGFTVTVLH